MGKNAIVVGDVNYINNLLNALQGTNFDVDSYPVFDLEEILEEESLFDDYFEEVYSELIDDKEFQLVYWTNKWESRVEHDKLYIYNKAINIGISGDYVTQGKDTAYNLFYKYGAESLGLSKNATYQDFENFIKQVFDWDGTKLLGYEIIKNIGLVKKSNQLEQLANQVEQRIGYFE